MKHEDITQRIIGAIYAVYNTLGYGFLEKVYQNAMNIELRKRGLFVEPQKKCEVFYQDAYVGEYFADFLVNQAVIVEIKAGEAMAPEHKAQVLNYLRASDVDVGLLLNFGPKAQFERVIFETRRRAQPAPAIDQRKSALESASPACHSERGNP